MDKEDLIRKRKRYRGDVDRLKVCVIGAGMSGLITIKELLDEDQAVVCYEKQNAEAGIFNLDDRVGNTAYDSALLTVSNYAMAFSCFPPKEHEERKFWTVKAYQRYLARFADFYNLRDYIQFNSEVLSIQRWKETLWLVTVRVGDEERKEVFDAIAVCSGAFQKPRFPQLPFTSSERGTVEILHARDYRRPERFMGKNVLCIGMGESGADIVHEIAMVADSAMLSVRASPPPLIPRYDCEHIDHIPNDGETTEHRYGVFLNQFLSRLNKTRDASTWKRARDRALARLDGSPGRGGDRYQRIADFIAAWNRRSFAGGLPFVSRFLNKNTVFVQDVVDGRLQVDFSGLARIDGSLCVFNDGTRFEVDAIMCCTGYEEGENPLFQADPYLREHLGGKLNPRDWFKHSIHPKIGKRLAFIGFARPTQGMLPACAELQARYFALLCSNRRALPPDVEARTEADRKAEEEMLKGDENVKTLVQYPYFSEQMAELIGCKPTLRTRLKDPHLAYKLFFGSMLSYRFRLDGPHRDPRTGKRVLKKLRVADTPRGQLMLGVLNARPLYEALGLAANAAEHLKRRLRRMSRGKDPGFHAWGPGQLRQEEPPDEAEAGREGAPAASRPERERPSPPVVKRHAHGRRSARRAVGGADKEDRVPRGQARAAASDPRR